MEAANVGKSDEDLNLKLMLNISRSIETTLKEWKEEAKERNEKGAKE